MTDGRDSESAVAQPVTADAPATCAVVILGYN